MYMLILWVSYGSFSVILSIYLLVLLGIKKEFSYSFYRLVQCDLFINVVTYSTTWVKRLCVVEQTKPFMLNVYRNYHVFFVISGFCGDFFYHIQSLSVFMLCLHRFTTVRYSYANLFWKKHYLTVYIVIVTSSAIFNYFQYTFEFIVPFVYYDDTDTFNPKQMEPWKSVLFWKIFITQSSIYFGLIIISSVLTLLVLKKRFASDEHSANNKKSIRKMAAIALINTGVYTSVIFWELFVATSTFMLMTVSDLFSLSMAYIMLICDRNVQQAIMKTITRPPTPSTVSVVMGNQNSNPQGYY